MLKQIKSETWSICSKCSVDLVCWHIISLVQFNLFLFQVLKGIKKKSSQLTTASHRTMITYQGNKVMCTFIFALLEITKRFKHIICHWECDTWSICLASGSSLIIGYSFGLAQDRLAIGSLLIDIDLLLPT